MNGYALFDEAFSSTDGVSISFDVAAWGGGAAEFGADGFAFFLVDGDQIDRDTFQIGGYGASLGYAPLNSEPGMTGVVLGIGFDEHGGFWNGSEGRTGPEGDEDIGGRKRNNIVLRAGANDNWRHLAHTDSIDTEDLQLACPDVGSDGCDARSEAFGKGRYVVHITILPGTNDTFDLAVFTRNKEDGEFVQRLTYTIDEALPENLKLGFSAGTGQRTNNHEVRTVKVQSLTDLSVEASVEAEEGYVDGRIVEYTYRIQNQTDSDVCATEVQLSLPDGFVIEEGGQSCTTAGEDVDSNCGNLGKDGVLYDVIPIGSNGEVIITIRGTLNADGQSEGRASARVTPTAGQGDENLSDNFHEVIEAYAQASTIQDHEVSSGAGKTLQIDLTEGALEGDAPID